MRGELDEGRGGWVGGGWVGVEGGRWEVDEGGGG